VFEIHRRHSLSKDEAKLETDRVVKEMENRLGLFGLVGHWTGDTLRLTAAEGTAQGTTGQVVVGEDAVHFRLSLSPALGMMRRTIEAGVAQFLKRSFPD
jgi:putative polyhydroxyalkanoate system protein